MAMRWAQAWEQEGRAGLRAAGSARRKPRLSAEQLDQIEQALLEGPHAFGYGTELWTPPRVAELIRRITTLPGESDEQGRLEWRE